MLSLTRALLCFSASLLAFTLSAQDMSNARLDSLLRANVDTLDGGAGRWQFVVDETPMFILTDEGHDRMRIISPIKDASEMDADELRVCLAANFHSALDVKYALSEGVLWAAFIHPLSPLRDGQFVDALAQVRSAVLTYGTTFASTDLVFPMPRREAPKEVEEGPSRDTKRL